MTKSFKLTKMSCYFANISMASAFCLPPLLFLTFRETYGISYTLLGTLVVVNFCTQLLIDLIFSFLSKHFNIHLTIKLMPLITSLGLIIYALSPLLFPGFVYGGLLLGTVIFSVAAGLCEVLVSPLIAAIPSDTPQRDMSLLHATYGIGVFSIVIISTLFLNIFGTENWMYLTLMLAVLPIIAGILFFIAPMPDMEMSHGEGSGGKKEKTAGLLLCFACIFLGSSAETTMSNWMSGFVESTLHLPKVWGDILGVASFALLLAIGRMLYAKYGKNIWRVLLLGMIGSCICYLIIGLSNSVIIAFIACILTGFCTSMLWPGTLILMEERMPHLGVAAYALMAAGGDFGASVAPQLLGVIVDSVSVSDLAVRLGNSLSLAPEQVGMKVGMLMAAIFPLLGIVVLLIIKKYFGIKKIKK